jgi:hypothetical protein
MKIKFLLLAFTGLTAFTLLGEEIKHRFLAGDESRDQVLYVDEFDPSNDWTVPLKDNRNLQILDNGNFLASVPGGYREYELKTGKMIKEVIVRKQIPNKKGKVSNCWGVARYKGKTYIGDIKSIIELDENDKELREFKLEGVSYFRQFLMTPEGNFILFAESHAVKEYDNSGKLIKTFDATTVDEKAHKAYTAVRKSNGNTVMSTGAGVSIVEVDKDWKLINKSGGKDSPDGDKFNFFTHVDPLTNGNYVIAHWTGHGPKDSEKGPQAIELDKSGKIVWQWHDPKRAGTFHCIVVIE